MLTFWAVGSIKSCHTFTFVTIDEIKTCSIVLTRLVNTFINICEKRIPFLYIFWLYITILLYHLFRALMHMLSIHIIMELTIFTVGSIESRYTLTFVVIDLICACSIVLTGFWYTFIYIWNKTYQRVRILTFLIWSEMELIPLV